LAKVTLTIIDHVNCHFDGLTEGQIKHIIDKTGITNPQLYHTVGYKLGHIDGKESYFDEEGFSFTFSIPEVLDIIERDFKIHDIELIDERIPLNVPEDLSVDADFLIDELGFPLREHQLGLINSSLVNHMGIFDAATSAGKSAVCLAISKALDPYIKTVIVVPSEQLLNQTFKDYEKSDLKVGKLNASIPVKKREKFVKDHNHIIVTNKLFMNCKGIFAQETMGIITDEAHVFGGAYAEVLRFDVPHYPFRIGLTGSFPYKNKLKSRMIKNHIGGDILKTVEPKELSDKGYVSKVGITLLTTTDSEVEDLFDTMIEERTYDWSIEQKYLLTNMNRVRAIGDYLSTLPNKNTLVLCHAQFGNKLSEYMGLTFIDKDTSVDERSEHFGKFSELDDHVQLASFGTSATGISENDIFIVVMIDVGKDRTAILQSIGRGMRKSSKQDHVDIIDISANLKYSKRHLTNRKSIYKEKHYPFVEEKFDIVVKGE
jgi:superfamily II DNA or RNA helicase